MLPLAGSNANSDINNVESGPTGNVCTGGNPSQYIVSGYGKTESGSGTSDLQWVRQDYVSDTCCDNAAKSNGATGNFDLPTLSLCAKTPDGETPLTDSCQGDSGGPLVWNANIGNIANPEWYVAGVVSSGTSTDPNNLCARATNHYGIYVSVAETSNRQWIEGAVANTLSSESGPFTTGGGVPAGSGGSSFNWYYYIPIAIAGLIFIVVIVGLCARGSRGSKSRAYRSSPPPSTTTTTTTYVANPQPYTTPQPAPAPSAPPVQVSYQPGYGDPNMGGYGGQQPAVYGYPGQPGAQAQQPYGGGQYGAY